MNRLYRVPPLISEVGGDKFVHLAALCDVFFSYCRILKDFLINFHKFLK